MKNRIILLLSLFVTSAYADLKNLGELTSPFTLAPLPYAYEALEPTIDTATMKLHHDKHHKAYVDKLNEALKDKKVSLKSLFSKISKESPAVRNNAGGHYNHSFYWEIMSPVQGDREMPEALKNLITKNFKSVESFKEQFEKAGTDQFGSGWVWLILKKDGTLKITATANQDNPLMDVAKERGLPILGADVWEHAYYLKYFNVRGDYLKNFWTVVNWKLVLEHYEEAKKMK